MALTPEQRARMKQAAQFWLTLSDPFASLSNYTEMSRLLWPHQEGPALGLAGISAATTQYTPKIAVAWDADLEALAEALNIWLPLMKPSAEIAGVPAKSIRLTTWGDGPGISLYVLDDGRFAISVGRRHDYIDWQPDLLAALAYIQRHHPPEKHEEEDGQTLRQVEEALQDVGLAITDQGVGWAWAWKGGQAGRAATKGRAIAAALKAVFPAAESEDEL